MIKFQKVTRAPFRLDLVPMINVVFLLLIFFMLTSTAMKTVLRLDLPEANSSSEISGENIIIKIDKDGVLRSKGQIVENESLMLEIKEKVILNKKSVVEIHADKSIKFESFGNIIKLAREAGAEEFIFATERIKKINQ